MANLLGPSAFGAARAAASRPSVTPDSSGSDTFFQDCSSPLNRDGTEIRAGWLNAVTALLRGLIRSGAVTENNADDMLTRAVRSQRANFVAASAVTGTANAIALAFSPTFAALSDLTGVPLRFLAEAANTTGVTLAVDGLTATALTWPDGTALVAGDIANGALIETVYDGTAFRMQQCLSPAQVRSLVGINKSPFNLQVTSSRTRTIKSGIVGFSDFMAGSYNKVSATSKLVVSILSNTFDGGTGANCSIARLTIGASVVNAVQRSTDASTASPAATAEEVFAGVAPGVIPWVLAHGRNDGSAWTTRICPNTTDNAFMPASTPVSVSIYEVE